MTRNEIFAKVVEYVQAQLPVDASSINEKSLLIEDLGADSANLMMLVMDLETEFDLTMDDDTLSSIKTIGDIVTFLEQHA